MSSKYRAPTYTLAVAALAFLIGRISARRNSTSSSKKPISSPRETILPSLTDADKAGLPYPPDALPGARDVDSPYGTFRCYEWSVANKPTQLTNKY